MMLASIPFLNLSPQKLNLLCSHRYTCYYKTLQNSIVTFTAKSKNSAVLGISGIHLNPSPQLEILEHALSCSGEIFYFSDMEKWNPVISHIPKLQCCKQYMEKLRHKLDNRVWKYLENCLFHGDFEKLIGFGPGLTPVGDDIFSGMVLADRQNSWRSFLPKIKGKTSDFSFQQIYEATNHMAPYPVKLFLKTGNATLLEQMGNTSGIGWLVGLTWKKEPGQSKNREE